MGHISPPSNLNVIKGITSHYYVILKMVILHDAMKTIQNGVFVFFIKEQKPVSFQKNKNIRIKIIFSTAIFFQLDYFQLQQNCLYDV